MVKLIIEYFLKIRQIKNPRNSMIELVCSMLNGTETMEIFLLDANKHRNYNNDLFNAIKIIGTQIFKIEKKILRGYYQKVNTYQVNFIFMALF